MHVEFQWWRDAFLLVAVLSVYCICQCQLHIWLGRSLVARLVNGNLVEGNKPIFRVFRILFFFSNSNYSKFILQEDTERTQINVLAVQAITSLVLSAMTIPVAGNPAVSCLEQQPRNKALKALDTRYFFPLTLKCVNLYLWLICNCI